MEFLKKTFFVIERVTRSKRFWALIIVLFIILSSAADSSTDPDHIDTEKQTYEYKLLSGPESSEQRILSVRIDGIILDEPTQSNPLMFFEEGITYGVEVKKTLERAANDPKIKAVFLEINSPGGTVTGSRAISDGIEYYRAKTKKPIYAHIGTQGLSGGYWSAAATDYITADKGTLVGSIGVILGPFKRYKDIVSEGGGFSGTVQTLEPIETFFFTAGEYKDTGSPYRAMADEEKKHWQSLVNESYAMFTRHVAGHRNIAADSLVKNVKAFPYDSKQALDFKLIDAIGSRDYSLNQLEKKAGLKNNDYQLIQEKKKYSGLNQLFSVVSNIGKPRVTPSSMLWGKPLFLYDPGYQIVY